MCIRSGAVSGDGSQCVFGAASEHSTAHMLHNLECLSIDPQAVRAERARKYTEKTCSRGYVPPLLVDTISV